MRDEQIRQEFADWLGSAQRTPPPDLSVIRRRLRRKRARNAVAGVALCGLAAGSVILIRSGGTPAPQHPSGRPSPVTSQPCNARDLQVSRTKPASQPRPGGVRVYLLEFRNAGAVPCILEGWPSLTLAPAPRGVSVSDGTLSVRQAGRGRSSSRVIEPTRVLLRPGQQAVSAVTLGLVPFCTGERAPAWSVTPPRGRASTSLPGGAASPVAAPSVCAGTKIVVSPVYPASVPVTQDYPRSAPSAMPASPAAAPPAATAGPGAAPYFIMIDRSRTQSPAVVYDWRSGRAVARVEPPAGVQGGFTGVTAAGDDATFVLAAGQARSRFYQLRLGPGGAPVGSYRGVALTPLPVPPVARPGTPFAVSADGTELALALPQGGGTSVTSDIMVVSLVTGATHTWRSPDPGFVTAMSWADPGSTPARGWAGDNELAFGWTDTAPGGRAAGRSGLRLLDTAAPGSDLLRSRLLVSASDRAGTLTGLGNPLISSDGTRAFVTMTSHTGGNPRAAVVEFLLDTGHPVASPSWSVVTPVTGESGMGTWCGALWADPSGRHALAACRAQGRIDGFSFTPASLHFPAPNFSGGQDFFAW